jgi:uncharacterized integral membrane protein
VSKDEPDIHGAMETDGATDADDGPVYGRVRHAPRYGSFVSTGAILGIVVGVVLALQWQSRAEFSVNTVAGYVAAILGLIGALLGGALAVLLDRRRR